MNTFKGFYQNKALDFPVVAEITLLQNSMNIHTADGNEREWFYGMIKRKKSKNGAILLSYESRLSETISIDDSSIVHEIKQLAPYTELNVVKPWWRSASGLYILLATKFGLIAIALLIYFLLIPVMIDVAVNNISVETEKNLGNKIMEGFFMEAPIDSMKTRVANEFLSELKLPGDYHIHISVLKSKEKNAFALPGGDIMIYSGIFDVMKTYPELVALLGHEIGHVEKRHSLKLLCRETSSGIILLVAIGNFSQVTSTIFSNARMFHQLSYNRRFEEEADTYGLDFMESNSVDRIGMENLFEHLKDSEKGRMNIQFLSTHPLLEKRIDKISKIIREQKFSSSENKKLDALWKEIKEEE